MARNAEESTIELAPSTTSAAVTKRFNIVSVPMLNLFLATDVHSRIRFSSDLVALYKLRKEENGATPRVSFGYDRGKQLIAVRLAATSGDPTAANVDRRGYASAAKFFRKTKLPREPRRYEFAGEQDGWLIFTAE